MNDSNALLVQRFREQDPNAFSELFGRYHSLVFSVCLRMLRHRQDAEDVTQETFSRVAKYIHRWDSKKPIEPWLVTIAGNRCRTHLSRRKPHTALTLVTEPSTDQTGELQAVQTLQEEVSLALAGLPAKQREAFQLFHESHLNYAEIGKQMGCPVGTVKTWVHRARRQLMQQLRSRQVLVGTTRNSVEINATEKAK